MAKRASTGKKMQSVHFHSVEECIDYLPAEEKLLTLRLREILFQCLPDLQEKLSFNVPFYKRKKGIFFIWPASILWGKKKTYEGVRLGFIQGHLMQDPQHFLDHGNRKQVAYHDFTDINKLEEDLLRELLFEASRVDDALADQ